MITILHLNCKTLELQNSQLWTVSLTLHGRTYSNTPVSLTLHGRTYSNTSVSLTLHGRTYSNTPVSLTLHGRTYTPGNELKQQLLQILQNCTNRGNRTITSGSRWQRVLIKRQRDEKEKIDNPKLIESAYYYILIKTWRFEETQFSVVDTALTMVKLSGITEDIFAFFLISY